MGLAEEEGGCQLSADDIGRLARLVAREAPEAAQLLEECYDEAIRLEEVGLCSQ